MDDNQFTARHICVERLRASLESQIPLALLVGQDAWGAHKQQDRVLRNVLERLGKADCGRGWGALLGQPNDAVDSTFYEWLTEQFERRPASEWLDIVVKVPWSVVATTALDQTLLSDLRIGVREPALVFTGFEQPPAARSRARPPFYCFYSLASITDVTGRPPRRWSELIQRQGQHVPQMLNNLIESMTPLGMLIVDGFSPSRDWLSTALFQSLLLRVPKGNIIWCGVEVSDFQDPALLAILREREALISQDRLDVLLTDVESAGVSLDDLSYAIAQPNAVTLKGGKRSSFVPTVDLRARIEAFASIVDDAWLDLLPPLSDNALYTEFRRFHGGFSVGLDFSNGVRRGFAITRDFEASLYDLVLRAATRDELEEPIILRGRSGTGKSIALTRLATRLRETAKVAVLLSRSRLPIADEVDEFCRLAERHGADVTVIICDLNLQVWRYRELLKGLRSRRRRIVIVGSSYADENAVLDGNATPETTIDAPARVTQIEFAALSALLNQFDLQGLADEASDSPYLLAQLYRTLPAARPQLMSGLSREARDAEARFRALLRDVEFVQIPQTELARKMVAAGLVSDVVSLASDSDDLLENVNDAAGKTIDLVMVAGQLGCSVPINLLMRAVSDGRDLELSIFGKLFQHLDVIRVLEDGDNREEYVVAPRLLFEAELLCRARLGSPDSEGSLVISLLRAARLGWDAGNTEHRFISDLAQKVGPDGPKGKWFKPVYLEIADALKEIRETSARVDPRLVLQESVLRRNAVMEGMTGGADPETVVAEAVTALDAAIAQIGNPRSINRAKNLNHLLVERASAYGFLANQRGIKGESSAKIFETYKVGVASADTAYGLSGEYRPIDVRLWTAARILSDTEIAERERVELRADIFGAIDEIENGPTLDPAEQRWFEERKLRVGQRIGDFSLSDEAFVRLAQLGSTAGYFIRAHDMAPNRADVEHDPSLAKRNASRAVAFLQEHWGKVKDDLRCVKLMFEMRWIAETGAYPFAKNRGPIPVSNAAREDLLLLAQDINVKQNGSSNMHRYLEATLLWCLNRTRDAGLLFQELSRSTEYMDDRRTRKFHLLTDETGEPMRFSGRITDIVDERTATITLNEVRRDVRVRSIEFPGLELEYNRTLSDFGIGFNFIGPAAEPLR